MLKTHASRLLATGAASTALALSGLAFTATPAGAASAGATYDCGATLGQVPVNFDVPTLPGSALAGIPIAALPVNAQFTLPANFDGMAANIDNLVMGVGPGDLPVSMTGTNSSGVRNLAGAIGSITPGVAIPIPVSFPKSFDLRLQGAKGAPAVYTCSQGAEPVAGTIQVSQQAANLKATAPKSVKASKQGQIKINITRQVGNPTGMVYAKLGKKTVGHAKLKRSGGQVVMKLAKLTPGSYKLKLKYEGDPVTAPASKTVKISVTR